MSELARQTGARSMADDATATLRAHEAELRSFSVCPGGGFTFHPPRGTSPGQP